MDFLFLDKSWGEYKYGFMLKDEQTVEARVAHPVMGQTRTRHTLQLQLQHE